MNYRLLEARYVRKYIVWLKFSDGVEGQIDLENELYGPVFEPLRNMDEFRKFLVDPELHTLVWSNGADISPEFLHDNLRAAA
ncbi:MAG: DUF2442 domain-containing protein [Gammaproteobacteria bacterium]|nr:DUF2442 domain-containing protein [Gammaproteobacteria bacterium]